MPVHKNIEYNVAADNAQVVAYGPVDDLVRLAERINVVGRQSGQNTHVDEKVLAIDEGPSSWKNRVGGFFRKQTLT